MSSDDNGIRSQSPEKHSTDVEQTDGDPTTPVKRKIDIEKPNWNIIESTFLSPRKSVTKVTKLVLNNNIKHGHSHTQNGNTTTSHSNQFNSNQNVPVVVSCVQSMVLSVNDQTAKQTNSNETEINAGKNNNENSGNLLKVEEFKTKKQDREKLNNEFKEFLVKNFNEVTNSNTPGTNTNEAVATTPVSMVKKVMATPPSKKPTSSPSAEIKIVSPCKKNKNYDPKEAREYIKEQQKKRKMCTEQTKVENKYEKEEIRKRLKELQERTTKIVQTNLQKSKKPKSAENVYHNSMGILRKPDTTPSTNEKQTSLMSSTRVSSGESLASSTTKTNEKSVHNGTPKSSICAPSGSRTLFSGSRQCDKQAESHEKITLEDVADEDHLEVPDVKLTLNSKSTSSDTPTKSSDTSFWLRPSSGVQIYPYNFIMAIRKKLEAIAEPKINNYHHTNINQKCESNKNSVSFSSSREIQSTSSAVQHVHRSSSNTVSDISSIQSEPIKIQNIFTSTHIEDVDQNKSTLKSSEAIDIPKVSPLSKDKIHEMKISMNKSGGKKDLSNAEFYKLLESFNKSLSQVIEVNQQLYSSLKNPPDCLVNFNRGSGITSDQNTQTSPKLAAAEIKKTEIEYSGNLEKITETVEPRREDIEETTIVPILNLNSSSPISASNNSDSTTILKTYTENKNESIDVNNTTLGSEIFSYFKDLNDTDLENSMMNYSEINLNYSKIGIYDKMIKNEQTKSEHLASLMKIREKSLIDRARGQIAWLEIQKQKFKEAGKREAISSIKKKQRALLMRLDKERASIHKTLKEKDLAHNEKLSVVSLKYKELHSSTSSISIRKRSKSNSSMSNAENSAAVKVYDLQGGANLSNLLQQREIELTKRRENVEKLLDWHRRLDMEEQQVVEMERQLYEFNLNKINNNQQHAASFSNNTSNNFKKIKKINRSLKILKNIPSSKTNTSTSDEQNNDESDDVVNIPGTKLNKLWYRLTGRKDRKFDENQIHNISKTELEDMYIEAKRVVLEENQILNLIETSRFDVSHGTNTEVETEPDMMHDEEDVQESTLQSEQVEMVLNSLTHEIVTNILDGPKEIEKDTTIESTTSNEVVQTEKNLNSEETKDSNTTYTVWQELEIQNSQTESEQIASVLNLLAPPESSNIAPIQQSTEQLNTTISSFLEDVSFPNFNDISSSIINLNDDYDAATIDNETDNNKNSSPKNDKTYDYDSSFDDNTSKLIEEEVDNLNISTESSLKSAHENEIETRLMLLDEGLKELSKSFEKIPAELKSPELQSPRADSRSSSEEKEMLKSEISLIGEIISDEPTSSEQEQMESPILMRNKNIIDTFPNSSTTVMMPDIISEAEVLRRQNIQILDSDKPPTTTTTTPPFLYLREIPNKPPPPYVPPAHGSQFTSVFPTEDRIVEIVLRRTKELYDIEFHGATEPENSIINENITNVYERIILDVCRELIRDFKVPEITSSYEHIASFHKNQLSFFNPPNRLSTIQSNIMKKIRKLLHVENQGVRPQTYTFVQGTNKRKRDLVDEILSNELNEEESKWTNFDLEEVEVKNKVTREIVQILVEEALNDFEDIYNKQLV